MSSTNIAPTSVYAVEQSLEEALPNDQHSQLKREMSFKYVNSQMCLARLNSYVTVDKPGLGKGILSNVDMYAERAEKMVNTLINRGCSPQMATEFSLLTLYDLVILIDDSSSMGSEGGERVEILRRALEEITEIYALANETGIKSVRFLNYKQGKKDIKTKEDVGKLIKRCHFTGVTRIGEELSRKILQPFVLHEGPIKKPLLVMIITDGQVEAEKEGLLADVILDCVIAVGKRDDRGRDAVAFQFSRIGNDEGAISLLTSLDNDWRVGNYVNCLPSCMPLDDLIKDNTEKSNKNWFLLSILFLGGILPYIIVSEESLHLTKEVISYEGLKNSEVFDIAYD